MRRLVYILCVIIFTLSTACLCYGQPEVMAWGNLTGIRLSGELIVFESSFRIVERGGSYTFVSGRERTGTAFRRVGDSAIIESGAMHVRYGCVVKELSAGCASVDLSYTSDSTRRIEGIYYCIELPGTRYVGAGIELGGKRIRVRGLDCRIEIDISKRVRSFVRKDITSGNEVIYIELSGGDLVRGVGGELSLTLRVSGMIDHSPVRVSVDPFHVGRRYGGLGGNFRLQGPNDMKVIDYCLSNMSVSYGRVELPWSLWDPVESSAPAEVSLHPHVTASMEMSRRLSSRGMPVIVSVWFPPEWSLLPGQVRSIGGVSALRLDSTKLSRIYASLGSYLLHLKNHYGVEAWAFSFNESDIGIDVLFSAEEHASFIKNFGAYLSTLGLSTRLLLGDNSDATTHSFVLPALHDPSTHPYIAAVSFHSWRGCDDATLHKWSSIARELNVPLIIGEGSTDAAAWRYPEIFLEPSFAFYEINLYLRILSICEPLSILQWQLTADYSLLWGSGIYGSTGELRPTQRFWNLRQLSSTPANLFSLPVTSSISGVNCAAFGSGATGEYVVHLVNNGASREATIEGIPVNGDITVYITDAEHGMKVIESRLSAEGTIIVDLPAMSYITILSGVSQSKLL